MTKATNTKYDQLGPYVRSATYHWLGSSAVK